MRDQVDGEGDRGWPGQLFAGDWVEDLAA